MKKLYTTLLTVALGITASAQTIIYVNDDATGNDDGSSWADAYTDLNDALTAASNGEEIWIAEGFYTRTSSNESFYVEDDELLYGGFAGTETDIDQRDIANHPTIISGDVGWNDTGVPSSSNSSMLDNSKNVFIVDSYNRALFDGLIIEHAFSTNTAGGGINIANGATNVQISNCIIRENVSMNRAGVLYYAYDPSSFYMFNNRIEDNVNTDANSSYTIEYRMASNNSLNTFSGDAHFVNNLFKHNISESSNSKATCARFTSFNGSEIYLYLTNNTFIDNHQTAVGQIPLIGYEFSGSGSAFHSLVNNNIFYNNSGANLIFGQLGTGSGSFDSQSASCNQNVQDFSDNLGMQNTHIVNSSPFVDYSNGDLTPITTYQTIGDLTFYDNQYLSIPLAGQAYPTTDLAGNPRFDGQGQIDIGAYQADQTQGGTNVEEENKLAFNCFPNPSKGEFTIEGTEMIEFVEIYSLEGKLIESKYVNATKMNYFSNKLTSGIYILKVISDVRTEEVKLIVE